MTSALRAVLGTVSLLSGLAHAAPVALVQYNGDRHFADPEKNLAALSALIPRNAQVAVLPEGAIFGYATPSETWCRPGLTQFRGRSCRDVSAVAQEIPEGWLTRRWAAYAREHGMSVVFQTPERDASTGRFFNTLVAVGPDGDVAAYRKRELYYIDEAYATPGVGPAVIRTAAGEFGLLICADANRMAFFDEYRARGVDGVIISMNWDQSPADPQRGASHLFARLAALSGLPLLVSDSAPWDGTGLYTPEGPHRLRGSLSEPAVERDGVALVDF